MNILRLCRVKRFNVPLTDITLVPNRDDPGKNDYFLTEEEIFSLSKQRMELYCTLSPVETTPEPQGPMCGDAPRGLLCNAGNCLATVTCDGKMYPCANAMVGGASLLEMSYGEAWEATKEAADQVVQAIECVGCAYENTCSRCPAFRLKDLHSGHCKPTMCEITRKLVAAGVKKLEQAEKSCD